MTSLSTGDPWVAALGQRSQIASLGNTSAKQAAQSFEALLIRQFLASAKSTSWLSEGPESESGWREIADDSLAGYLVKAGGLGLTKQIESLLNQSSTQRSLPKVTAMTLDPKASLNVLDDSTVKTKVW